MKTPTANFILPNNFLAEQIILGSIYLDKSILPQILEQLSVEAFYFPEHKILYKTIISLYKKNINVELTTTIYSLQENKLLDTIGGIQTLTNITTKVTTTLNIEKYIALLQEKYFRRLLILLGKSIIEMTCNSNISLGEILEEVEERTFKLTIKRFSNSLSNTSELVNEVLIDIQTKFQETSSLAGLATGFKDLDPILQGLNKADLIILAGRPSMGKTAFSLNIATNISKNHNLPVLLFSLEMSKQQLIYRLLALLTGINSMKIRSGNLSSFDWEKLKEAIKSLSQLPIYIDDTSYITFSEIRAKSQQILQGKENIGLIIVDYLQLMELKNSKNNRNQELSIITRSLKVLAKELDIPILVLSQLSRTVESRLNKRPILSDLRDSGCLVLDSVNKKAFTKKKGTKIFQTGRKPSYKLRLKRKLSISVTATHRIFTNKGWQALGNMSLKSRFKFLKIQNFGSMVSKIFYKGVESVFDISISNNNNYLFGHQLLHNSIEQDADVVLMLYRDDYYDKKSLTPGFVEIIIAKHRNGPIGSVNLTFNNKSLKFETIK